MTLSRYEHAGAAPTTGLTGSIGASDGSFMVVSGAGYPTGAVGLFVICIDAGLSSEEKILCSGRSGTTFTVAPGGRGYDNTVASSHSGGTMNVTHVLAAAELDDDNAHIYTTSRDDHTQYSRTDGTRAFTGPISVPSGTSTFATTTVTGVATATTQVATDQVRGTNVKVNGVTGANVGVRLAGATTSGAPVSGTFLLGDVVYDQTGTMWTCTTAGTVGSGAVFSLTTADSLTLTGTSSELAGSPPSATTQFVFQGGTSVPVASSGAFSISFPTAFPNGVLTVICSGASSGAAMVEGPASCTTSGFTGTALDRTGTTSTGPVRINWIAIGW